MPKTVFIDGEVGTTGLQIRQRLAARGDLSLKSLPESQRKDPEARSALLNEVDLAVLCLPDDAAREAVSLIKNPEVKVIDASTAHRVDPNWVYGFPEAIVGQQEAIAGTTRVSNPGCYPTGAIALLRPLTDGGLIPQETPITIHAVSGYTGGGRKMIEAYEDKANDHYTEDPIRPYGLGLQHKHVPEMRHYCGLAHDPLFSPSVGRYAQGMIVNIPVHLWALPEQVTLQRLYDCLADHYSGQHFVSIVGQKEVEALQHIEPQVHNDTNHMSLYVFGNERQGQVLLTAVLDNLGKGASGAAVQNLNIMLGFDPKTGL